jgi:hypothetical protein
MNNGKYMLRKKRLIFTKSRFGHGSQGVGEGFLDRRVMQRLLTPNADVVVHVDAFELRDLPCDSAELLLVDQDETRRRDGLLIVQVGRFVSFGFHVSAWTLM